MDYLNRAFCGHALDFAHQLPAQGVDCVVTSPPYWGLREYGHPEQYGQENTPQDYIAHLVELFLAIKPALKKTATIWLNLGDVYSGGNGNYAEYSCGPNRIDKRGISRPTRQATGKRNAQLPAKNLLLLPHRVAMALQDEGFILRSTIIWHKLTVIPESVKDRPTHTYEYIFLFSISKRYWYNQAAVMQSGVRPGKSDRVYGSRGRDADSTGRKDLRRKITTSGEVNLRDIWAIAPEPYREAHFATFPPEIPRRCVSLGCPESGVVYDPFLGSGTVAEVAQALGRNWVGSELNPDYVALIEKRLLKLGMPANHPDFERLSQTNNIQIPLFDQVKEATS